MQAALAKRISELVECGWEPQTTTDNSASLTGRRPFSWWLFLLVVIFFPIFGGILYLIFWMSTSRATLFLHQEGDEVTLSGDTWLVQIQEVQREAYVQEHRQIKERGFWPVMWPKLVTFLVFLFIWVAFLRWFF